MYEFSVTPEFLLVIFAGLLALVFDYIPGVATWYDGLDTTQKRQVMAVAVIGIALVIFLGQCFAIFLTNIACTVKGGFDMLKIVFLAVGVNQAAHTLFKPTDAFKARAGLNAR